MQIKNNTQVSTSKINCTAMQKNSTDVSVLSAHFSNYGIKFEKLVCWDFLFENHLFNVI